jgi:hypothetical protein
MGGPEGIGAGDPEGRRTRLEAEILPGQHRNLGRRGLETGGVRIRQGYHLDGLYYLKDPTDPAWKNDPGVKTWQAFMDKYYPDGDKSNANNVYGYVLAQNMVQVLKQCGDNLPRENVMKQAASLKDFSTEMMLPGIKANTNADDFFPIEQMQLMKFDGEAWQLFGDVIAVEVGH